MEQLDKPRELDQTRSIPNNPLNLQEHMCTLRRMQIRKVMMQQAWLECQAPEEAKTQVRSPLTKKTKKQLYWRRQLNKCSIKLVKMH